MTTIILCGGRGIRLNEETEFTPKPLVSVGDKPLVWHIMKIYSHYGFKRFILALGYKANYIKEFFLKQKTSSFDFSLATKTYKTIFYPESREEVDDFEITFVDTGLETLIGERLLHCQKYIPKKDKHFMVTYGDGVTDLDIRKLVKFHKKQGTVGTVTGIRPRSKFGLVKVGKDYLVEKLVEKPLLLGWINGGFMVFNRNAFKYFRAGEMEHPALKRMIKKKQLSLYQHEGFWYAVDTFKELEKLRSMWDGPQPPWRVWK